MHKRWYQNQFVYQIYPASFKDSNGDGIGDLNGITEEMSYLERLGVHLVHLNPIFMSPMADNGYDVSNYYDINPLFGNMDDFDRMVWEGRKHGIRFILDMAVNHCSDEHPWFQEALKDPEGEYGQYFYFRKGKDGQAPNNWRSIFGGSAWEKVPGTDYYYLHIFAKKQVDLNWECRDMREKVYQMMNWWLAKGIAGFRLDAITYLKKAEGLPSYPADAPDGLCSPNYGSLNVQGIEPILREIKEKTYGRREIRDQVMTIGEVAGVEKKDIPHFISQDDGYFSVIYDFALANLEKQEPNIFWFNLKKWTPEDLKKRLFEDTASIEDDCWYLNMLENHDQSRMIDRMLPEEGRNFHGASLLGLLNFTRVGSPLLYQGMELGMRNHYLTRIEDYQDIQTREEYSMAINHGVNPEQAFREVSLESRDHARMPFQWKDARNAGFSDAKRTWLPVNPDYHDINAEKEDVDPGSLLNWYRKLIQLRTNSTYADVLTYGRFVPKYCEIQNLVAYSRERAEQCMLILLNYQNRDVSIPLEDVTAKVILSNYGRKTIEGADSGEFIMKPFEAIALDLRPQAS